MYITIIYVTCTGSSTTRLLKPMAKEKKEKSKFRIYAEYYPFCVLYGILHLLPLKVGYAICTFLFRLLFNGEKPDREKLFTEIYIRNEYTIPEGRH